MKMPVQNVNKDGLTHRCTERREKRFVTGPVSMRQKAFNFFAALRFCAKTGIVLCLGSVLALFSGCGASQKGPSVARLEGGGQGFVLREKPNMDARGRDEFKRALAMMKEGNTEAAIALLTGVISRSPGVTAPYIDIAAVYLRIGKPELAEQNLKIALGLVPGHPVASNEYGLLLRRSGRFKEAREVYEKAIDNFPDYLPVRRNLGILCDLYLSDPACGLKQFEIYSEGMPDDAQVKIWIAELRNRRGKN